VVWRFWKVGCNPKQTQTTPNATFRQSFESLDLKQNFDLLKRAGFLQRLCHLKFLFSDDETVADFIEMSH